MKLFGLMLLGAAILLVGGCKKGEDGSTELMSAEEVAEKTEEVVVKTTEKAAEVTAKAEKVTKETAAAVSSFTVKAEDVMGDLNKSVDQIKQQVAGFDKSQVIAYANKYKDIILDKKDQIAELTEKVKGLSLTEVATTKGKELKSQLSQYTEQLSALKDRYAVYIDKLEEFGVDLSAYGL